jgi:hypothetical protein
MEIRPAHLNSAGRQVLAGHGPSAKWPAPSTGTLSCPSTQGTVSPRRPQMPTVPPFSGPRRRPHVHLPSLSTAARGLSSKPNPFSPSCSSLRTASAPYHLCLPTRVATVLKSPALPSLKHWRRCPCAPMWCLWPEHVTELSSTIKNGHNDTDVDAGLV